MPTETEAENGSVNAALAKYLSANEDAILGDWRKRVLSDDSIGTARSVNTAALTHRLPHLLDDLVKSLRHYRPDGSSSAPSATAADYGRGARQQGYHLSEFIRELRHFRAILIYHLRRFEDLHSDHGMAAMLFVSSVSHGFLDDLMISITEEFLSAELEMNDERWRRRIQKTGGNSTPGERK